MIFTSGVGLVHESVQALTVGSILLNDVQDLFCTKQERVSSEVQLGVRT